MREQLPFQRASDLFRWYLRTSPRGVCDPLHHGVVEHRWLTLSGYAQVLMFAGMTGGEPFETGSAVSTH